MAASKSKSKAAATQILAEVTKTLMSNIEEEANKESFDGRYAKLNAEGGILKAKFTLQPKEKAPNPLCITVNEEIFWVPRGHEVIVPWYVVTQMKNNIERRFKREKDERGKNIVTTYDAPSEPFNYTPINPAPGVEL
jgi:hypothetical protein